ncbi:MAG: hypothetical protein JXA25_04665 [Anaerolineales bacterium]|nr:hypothetical protein [Anaerolineales bacterium]
MSGQRREWLKNLLGDMPGTAELAQALFYQDRPPTSGYKLERLSAVLPQWVQEADKARAVCNKPSEKRILLVGFLRWWLEYAAALGLLLYGQGYLPELAYVPYREWLGEVNKFDRRRQASLIERTFNPARQLLPLHNLSRPVSVPLPEKLLKRIEELTLIDVQYSRQRETLHLGPGGEDEGLYQLRWERNKTAAEAVYSLLSSGAYQQVIVPNGSIFEFGAVYQTARFLQVPVVTFEFGEQRERIWLAQDSEVMLQDTARLWLERGDLSLTDKEEQAIQDLYAARMGGELWKNFQRRWQASGQAGGEAVRTQLGLDADRPVVLLCTNVVGDSLALGRQLFTNGMVDWLARTAEYFAEHPQAQLVIRVHPGELRSVGDPSVDIVRRTLPAIPENIIIVPPESPVNTYDLIQIADLGLVYTTTVGMEMAMAGIPVMVGARTHYRGKGFTIDADTFAEYAGNLDVFLENPEFFSVPEEQALLAWRYAYRFFFEFALPFPWHIVGFMKDIKERPIAQVSSEAGMEKYGLAVRTFAGEPLQYGISEYVR